MVSTGGDERSSPRLGSDPWSVTIGRREGHEQTNAGPQGRADRARHEPGQHRRCATPKEWAGGARGARSDPPRPGRDGGPQPVRGTRTERGPPPRPRTSGPTGWHQPLAVAGGVLTRRARAQPESRDSRRPSRVRRRGTRRRERREPGLNTPPTTATMTPRGAARRPQQRCRRRGTRSRPRPRRRSGHQHRRRAAATAGRRRRSGHQHRRRAAATAGRRRRSGHQPQATAGGARGTRSDPPRPAVGR